MSDLIVSSKTTPYGTSPTGRYSGISSTTSSSTKSSSSTVYRTVSSTTMSNMTGILTSSTTTSYGASSTQSAVKITSSSTTVNTSSTTSVSAIVRYLDNEMGVQKALKNLGFYNDKIDGNLESNASKKAIINFQKVYGLNESGTMNENTCSRLAVADYFKTSAVSIVNNTELSKIVDEKTKENFACLWAFLRVGMNLSVTHASAVMGNINAESGFSSDNLQNTNNQNTLHDPEYIYNAYDGRGYGLLQWTYYTRKSGLEQMSKNMNLSVSDINVQLAFFREEMTNPTTYAKQWQQFLKTTDEYQASDYFLEEIESPAVKNYTERRKYTEQIMSAMCTL